jgi:hypothetical protein
MKVWMKVEANRRTEVEYCQVDEVFHKSAINRAADAQCNIAPARRPNLHANAYLRSLSIVAPMGNGHAALAGRSVGGGVAQRSLRHTKPQRTLQNRHSETLCC